MYITSSVLRISADFFKLFKYNKLFNVTLLYELLKQYRILHEPFGDSEILTKSIIQFVS